MNYFSSPDLAGASVPDLDSAGVELFDSGVLVAGVLVSEVFFSEVFAGLFSVAPFFSSLFFSDLVLSSDFTALVEAFSPPRPPVCDWPPTNRMMSIVERTQTMATPIVILVNKSPAFVPNALCPPILSLIHISEPTRLL